MLSLEIHKRIRSWYHLLRRFTLMVADRIREDCLANDWRLLGTDCEECLLKFHRDVVFAWEFSMPNIYDCLLIRYRVRRNERSVHETEWRRRKIKPPSLWFPFPTSSSSHKSGSMYFYTLRPELLLQTQWQHLGNIHNSRVAKQTSPSRLHCCGNN